MILLGMIGLIKGKQALQQSIMQHACFLILTK
jgi:hypothetical protein